MEGRDDIPLILPPPVAPLPKIAYPPWMDPMYCLHVCRPILGAIQNVGASGIDSIAPNPRRWAIWFVPESVASTVIIRVSPFPDPNVYFVGASTATRVGQNLLFDLFRHGPIVPGQWYVGATAGTPYRVLEFVLF